MTASTLPAGQEIQRGWLIGCLLLGAIGVASAFVTEARWGWAGTGPAFLLEFGSSFFLAAILFLLERRFVRETRAIEARLEARSSELETRVDRLTETTSQAVAERHRAQDAVLDRLDREVSFTSVAAALGEASRWDAIDSQRFRVKASPNLNGLRVRFGWVGGQANLGPSDQFWIDLLPSDPSRRVTWSRDQSAPAVGAALVEVLELQGLDHGPDTFDWGFAISELKRSLHVAIGARRRDPGSVGLRGRMIELVDQEWVLTDAGIECPSRSFVFAQWSFPDRSMAVDGGTIPGERFNPEAPPWVRPETWDQLVRLGLDLYPFRIFRFA